MSEFSLPIRVYIEDTDAGGIVYYVNYLKYMERARTEYLRKLGYDKPAVFDHQLMFVVHSLSVAYLKSAELDDEIRATASMVRVSRAAFTVEQKIWRGDELLCEAEVRIACIGQHDRRPAAIPADMLTKLREVTAGAEAAAE